MEIKIDFDIKQIEKSLNKFPDRVEKAVVNVMNEAAEEILQKAKSRVPVKSGNLKNSLKKSKVNKKDMSVRIFADYPDKQNKNEYYAFAVEHGTKEMPAQPYLKPASHSVEGGLQNRVDAALYEEFKNDQI